MSAPRVLVVDGNVADLRRKLVAAVGYDTGTGYARTLMRVMPALECDVVYPADLQTPAELADRLRLYDGVAITGSALCISDGGPAVERQIELAAAVFEAGVPLFGSCWGLQVAVAAAGGVVTLNPRGREFGFARRLLLTDAGREHPLFVGKPAVFEAPTVHRDHIETLPGGAVVLAGNEMGLQAAVFSYRRGTCWGVQYHPEYGYGDLAAVARRYGMTLVQAGIFTDMAALDAFAVDMDVLHANPRCDALLWKHGLGPAMHDERVRRAELSNWLSREVLAHSDAK
ncbi:MAG: gamma-glutamyl-gamma-aminobutyrate hydrolase family protein [Steroidobacteraceae bacterium]